LTDARIEVLDQETRRITYLAIAGRLGDHLEISVHLSVYDDARQALLVSLGAPPDPQARIWEVTAEHLRGLVP
jgi:hypothetical protein